MAQLASALRSGRRGRVFESPLPDKSYRSNPEIRGCFFYSYRFVVDFSGISVWRLRLEVPVGQCCALMIRAYDRYSVEVAL